ncbi:MAG: ZIP family metal transporter [Gammaproteobacteria bacterium]|nr:ZIP family metal transporter [Gammaproteobacteria bacterium]
MGIFIASYMIEASASRSGELLSGMLNAVTAGTFLYLGTEHLTEHLTKDKKSFEKIAEGISLIFGITLMALVAIWV